MRQKELLILQRILISTALALSSQSEICTVLPSSAGRLLTYITVCVRTRIFYRTLVPYIHD